MRITLTLLTLLQSLFLLAQTADLTTGCAPLEVKFTPPAGAASFFWDFQDGGTSLLANPSHIFTVPGTYNVEFRQSSTGPVVGTVAITVYPKPEIGIVANPESGCIPLNVQFTDTTQLAGDIQVQAYSWVFGDGGNGTGANVSHVYNTVGAFTVSLELTTNYATCNVTKPFTDLIHTGIQPNVNFTTNPDPPVACDPPLQVSFTNTTTGGSGSLTYTWDLGNGNTSNLVDPPAQTYTQIGVFTVVLTATDAVGCSASTTQNVNIGKPLADFSIADTICLGSPVTFQNASDPGIFNWSFGPNASPQTSAIPNPEVTFNAPGLQTVTLTVTTGVNCSSTVSKQVYVEEANANFTVTPVYSCDDPTVFNLNATSGTTSEWEWTFSDGTTANTPDPTYTWTTPDTTGYTSLGLWLDTVILKVTTPHGCMDEFMVVDSIWRPNARFVPDLQHGCAPLTVVFADSSISNETIVEWTWLFDDGTAPVINNTNDPATHTFTEPGDYNVRLVIRNSAGCIDTSYAILIEVGEPINGDFTADKFVVCPGDTVQFTNLTNDPRVDGWHFSSDNDRLWHCFQDENPVWVYNSETGPMSVSLTTEYNGCFTTVTRDEYIQVNGPIAQLHYKTTCDNTLQFEFTDESHDATTVTWYLGNGDSSVVNNFTYDYAMPGAYTVILKAENPATGCPVSYDTATVYPNILEANFELPDTICGGTPQTLDARNSLGVNATCYKGYTWFFDFQRPIRTDKDTMQFMFGPSGPHQVWLEVEGINGCKDTVEQDIYIYNRFPEIAADKNLICVPGTVAFTDLSTADAPIVSWEWDFGDGNTSNEVNPTHTFTTPPPNGNSFNVMLRIEDAFGCPGMTSFTVQVYKPVSAITTVPQPANICEGESIIFTASDFTAGGSNLSWAWNFGNGNTDTGQASTQTFTVPGLYQVKVVYTEIATGCKDSTFAPVNVQGYPLASFASNVDGQDIICYPQNMLFANTTTSGTPVSVVWDLGNGLMPTGDTTSTVFPKGTYTVSMIATTSFGCADTVSRTFTVVGPEGTFELDKNIICVGDDVTFTLKDTVSISSWTWDFNDGNTANNVNPVTHTFGFRPPSNTTTVRLILRGEDDACTVTVEQPVNFSPVQADFDVSSPLPCPGASIVFNNTSTQADLSSWDFGDGGTSQLFNPDHIFNAIDIYTVTLIVTDLPLGCMDTATMDVAITGLQGLELFGDTICPGDTALIGLEMPIQGATYIWSPVNQVLQPNNEAVVEVVASQTTTFQLQVIDPQGCQGEATTTVFIPTPYSGAQDLDTIIAKGEQVILPVAYDPLYMFTWTPAPGPQGDPPTAMPDSSITYTLVATDLWGCTDREFMFNIQVVPENVYAPNAFTPNGDGTNDVFNLLADGDEELVQVLTLKVFSRWGELVYEGTGPLAATGWDGRYNGKEAPSDVYVWTAEVEFLTGRRVTLKGDLTLLR
ncbi:MAG: PKD domain-containing protein [Bacteroidetes bacterium]|nr:MAG: PKD domain-containing protein [Bacteroidota bacterium]